MIGPALFLMYVNDIDDDITCKISKFADDTKITSRVTSSIDKRELQQNLNRLVTWIEKQQIKLNADKCKVTHIGNSNDHVNYTLNGFDLSKVNQEKDLGIIISRSLKPEKHISKVVKTANKLTGFIGRAFEYK